MNLLAKQSNAINLGQGFPDFDMPRGLIEEVYTAMCDGKNQYAHMNGVPALREAIAQKIKHLYGAEISAEESITITPGGTYAIYTSLTSLLQPGDEVIVLEPAFDSYVPNIVINGARPIFVPLTFPGYSIDWQLVEDSITPATKLIMINSPHNPTGSVIGESDIKALKQIIDKYDIRILSDEVYEHVIFDGLSHHSILKYPELLEKSFVCFSFGKVFNCTGWKLGYCVAMPTLMHEFRKVHQFNCFSCNAPVQYGLANYISDPGTYSGLSNAMQAKRDYLRKLMEKTSFQVIPSHGSYFELYDYSAISNLPENEFAENLCKLAGVAGIPVSAFYHNGTNNQIIRFCFSKVNSTLDEAVERLVEFEKNLRG